MDPREPGIHIPGGSGQTRSQAPGQYQEELGFPADG
jgi:hypothetical protein